MKYLLYVGAATLGGGIGYLYHRLIGCKSG